MGANVNIFFISRHFIGSTIYVHFARYTVYTVLNRPAASVVKGLEHESFTVVLSQQPGVILEKEFKIWHFGTLGAIKAITLIKRVRVKTIAR